MATGAGKTRTIIALSDLLMRANWAKRVLFLCDRTALVNQAVGAFKAHLPGASPINLVTEGDQDGRVYVSTYQTMIGKIDEYRPDGTRRFGVGHFDLVVIDEAQPIRIPQVPGHLRVFRLVARRAHRDPEGRGRQEHLRPVRSRDRRAHRRLLARRGNRRRLPGTTPRRVGAAQVRPRRHQVRRAVRGREGRLGRT